MPNWCENEVRVDGEPEQVQRFKEYVKSENNPFDFNKIIPMPEELRDVITGATYIDGQQVTKWWERDAGDGTIVKVPIPEATLKEWKEKHGACDWYDWAVSNWGTKWNTNGESVNVHEDGDSYLEYRFDTAWSPPSPVFHALRKKFPDLGIVWFYREEGMQFAGYLNAEERVGR